MKQLFFIILALTAVYANNSIKERFLLDTLTNVVNSVTNTVNNVVQTTQNVISTTQLVGQILWDNAVGPSVDMFLNRN